MRRGTLSLTKEEQLFLMQHLKQNLNLPQEVHDRVAALSEPTNQNDAQNVFFNENSIESLLDSLPAPTAKEAPALASLRNSLRNFLLDE